MKKYEKYKDSEIKWLGKIPEHWEIRRIKDLGEYKSGNFIDVSEIDYSSKYAVMGGNGLRGYTDKFNRNGSYILIGRQGALCGNINYATGKFWATEHAVVVHHKKNINIKWLGELLRVMNLNQYSFTTAQPGLSVEKIKALKLPLVPFEEQVIIANYLDTKTQLIDKRIELLNKKIQKYKELRKTIVNKTVCRGLDSKVKFKESGIEWIGKIPEHWKLYRLKKLGSLETSSIDKKIKENEQLVKLINYTDVYNNNSKELRYSNNYMEVSVNKKQLHSKTLKIGDILFTPSSETREDIGVSAVVMENLYHIFYSYHLLRLRFYRNDIFILYKKYLFNNSFVQYYFSSSSIGTTRKILGLNTFNNLLLPLPPYKEQVVIAYYLNNVTKIIDSIINNIQQQITKLQELRKTLINDVVTGKIKVTE